LLLLIVLNGVYFWYHAEKGDVPAHAYRKLTGELSGLNEAEAFSEIEEQKKAVRSILYGVPEDTSVFYNQAEYCDNLWQEYTLFTFISEEYSDVTAYREYLGKVIRSAEEYKRMTALFGEDKKILADIEKTSRDYQKIDGLTISYTRTRGISEALSLPSSVFLEMLLAVFLASVLFAKEKEQGLLRLYASMSAGRGRMFAVRIGVLSLAVAVSNALFFTSTILTGCFLYGFPTNGFLTMPLQSLAGYKTAAAQFSIGTFLLTAYVWTWMVSVLAILLASFFSMVLKSAMRVYIVLFSIIAVEGYLYLMIDARDYRSVFRRINLISFADSGYSLGQYHNEVLFGAAWTYAYVALALMMLIGTAVFCGGVFLINHGFGATPKKSGRRQKAGDNNEQAAGTHTSILVHEAVKFFRFEKIGLLLIVLLLNMLFFTKPYHNYFGSMEQVFYQTYLERLGKVEPEEYERCVEMFREEFATEKKQVSKPEQLRPKETALAWTEDYVAYLRTKDGARAVDSRGYELLYNDRIKNVILAAASILAAILCGTALYAVEYRSGMDILIRTSAERKRVAGYKILLLIGAITACFLMIYGRYIHQVISGYGTEGVGYQANSIRDWEKVSSGITIGLRLTGIYIKRFCGMLLAAYASVLIVRKIKNFLLSAVISVMAMIIPLVLCLIDSGIVSYLALNWFFVL